MFGKITEFAIQANRITFLVLIGIPLLGILIFLDYPRQEDPSIEIREAIVTAFFPGMDVYEIEDLITFKIEEKIRELGEVEDIWSHSKNGTAIVHVELEDWVEADNIPRIWNDLRNRMDDLAPHLPLGTVGPFVNDEFGLTAVATIALWSDGFSLEDMRRVARDVRRRLDALRGVEQIETFGVQQERVFLDISNVQLARLGIRPGTIVETLRSQNVLLPGGVINADGRNIVINPSGTFDSVDEVASILIPLPDSDKTIPLKDVVTVSRDYQDPADRPAFFNGRPALVLSVSILDGTNSVEFGQRLTERLEEIERTLPFGYFLEYATFQPDLVEVAVNGAISNLIQTLVIVLVVVILFLGLRTGLIVGSFVPLTMLLGLIGMSIWDVELQRMSIATMIIALGLMVDNAVVVAESIRNRLEQGEDRKEAVVETARGLGLPLLVATLTTILAFMPISMAIGSVGEYTESIGQVVILVLLASWFMSMYMTPTMSYWFMKVKPAAGGSDGGADLYDSAFYRVYRGALEALLRHRLLCIAGVVAVAVGIGSQAGRVVQEFFPANDRNQFLLYLDLEAGAHIDETARVTQSIADWLLDETINPEVTGAVAYAGSGGPRFFLSLAPINPDPHVAFVLVETESNDQVPDLVERTRAHINANYPEVHGKPKAMWLGPSETGLIEFRISGPEEDVLMSRAEHLLAALRAVPGTIEIEQDWENRVLQIEVLVDQTRARRAGVTSADIATTLNAFVSGGAITDYREGDAVIPIVLRGEESERNQISTLRAIDVYSSAEGTNVPLTQIAEIRSQWKPYTINRRNLERTVTVSATNPHLSANELVGAVVPALESLDLPPGYRWEMGGELENAEIAQGHLFANFPIAGFLIVTLLVWQFNSYRRAAIILLTIPMSFVGAVLGLLITGVPFGFMTILGLLSLAGIIINNGIVMIDSVEAEREAGADAYTAIVTAAVSRFRPIMMTTITTVLGLAPLIIWQDPLFMSMAIVISFGLAIGTLLTLGVVPVIYSLFLRVKAPAKG
ncbi:MAG: efflux RND transporter permease subunit [Kiloniellales bacterium]|nr:efflux RND transporter permease subunit [Kiloniellales bacterium]